MNRSTKLALISLILLSWTARAHAGEEDLLKSKGLTRAGDTYILEIDAKSSDQIRALSKMRLDIELNQHRRDAVNADIHRADSEIAEWDCERSNVAARMESTKRNAENYNKLVDQNNQLLANIRDALRYKEARENDLKAMSDGQDDYITTVVKTSDAMEAGAAQYAALAADQSVKDAITKLNQDEKKKLRLGPSATWQQHLDFIRRQRASIDSAVIPVDTTIGVPQVMVSLNGKPSEQMVFDSGAGLISLNAATARSLGLTPGRDDPTLQMKVANGKIVKARLMVLKSVRVGQFTVNDVQCAIMPREAGDADNLLGESFLQHFVYRMDLAAGALHLSQLAPLPDRADAKNKSVTSTSPSTTPATPTPATAPSVQPAIAKSNDGEDVFSSLTGDTSNTQDGAIVLTGKQHISTAKTYPPNVTFKIIAMTDSTDIRMHYDGVAITLNWETHLHDLLINGKPTGRVVKKSTGKVNVNQWLNIELKIEPDRLTLAVDGEQRCSVKGNFADAKDALTISTFAGATIKVKSVKVLQQPLEQINH
ncbi:MAG TPA: retropepsin-like aspartic protease [Tepidisphaeraceae bacterium]|jgi:aspartyl protease family protein|nr:retropepsin-like aspartic protease [Tepidisphaeraceae bacterium]